MAVAVGRRDLSLNVQGFNPAGRLGSKFNKVCHFEPSPY